jgi:glycosyl transferase / beta-hydroxylase protein BlmF
VSGPRISVLAPTRNRPGSVARLIASACGTAAGPLEFVFYTDGDAPLPPGFTAMAGVKAVTGPRITMSGMWDACWRQATADVFMMCCDQVAFRTPGWDEQVLAAFGDYDDRIVMVYGNDLFHPPGDGATLPFLHRAWTDALGYFSPPYFAADFADAWIGDIATTIGRRRYVPVITEHLHPAAGKNPWDQTHQERLQRLASGAPRRIYDGKAAERQRDAQRLAGAIAAKAGMMA